MTPRLKEKYKNEIIKNLMSKLNQKNMYSVPKIKKIVINMGLGGDGSDKKILKSCIQDISAITGQHPIVTKFKKSISNFKSRKGTDAGLKVTLRNDRVHRKQLPINPLIFTNGNTDSFTLNVFNFLISTSLKILSSKSPVITLAAILAIGIPLAFATKGTVLLALGFTSNT